MRLVFPPNSLSRLDAWIGFKDVKPTRIIPAIVLLRHGYVLVVVPILWQFHQYAPFHTGTWCISYFREMGIPTRLKTSTPHERNLAEADGSRRALAEAENDIGPSRIRLFVANLARSLLGVPNSAPDAIARTYRPVAPPKRRRTRDGGRFR